jgi:hypothetical protein
MRRLLLAFGVIVASCGGPGPSATPHPVLPTVAPSPSQRPAADVPVVLTAVIDDDLCTKPAPKWCKYLKKANGLYKIDARPGSITIQTVIPSTARGRRLAARLCAALAVHHFDPQGVRLDYNHIHVFRERGTEQADCGTKDSP